MTDTPSTPPELIPARAAADRVGRSLATVRAWVRAGRLVGYREHPADPRSRLMLHPAELAAVAAELDPDGKHGDPLTSSSPPPSSPPTPRPAADEGAAVEVARLRAELDGARAILAEARRRGDDLALALTRRDDLAGDALAEARRRADAAEGVARDLRGDLEAARAELVGARAELAALKERAGLSWWHRLIGARPTLPDAEGERR